MSKNEAVMTQHIWLTTRALPGRSYFICTRCGTTEHWRLKDGKWHTRSSGPKECEEGKQ